MMDPEKEEEAGCQEAASLMDALPLPMVDHGNSLGSLERLMDSAKKKQNQFDNLLLQMAVTIGC